jgi:G3E family GTPase
MPADRPVPHVPPGRIPLTVLGGYLGAGKTTVLNRLLAAPGGRRIGVVVNDFGSVGIDAEWLARTRSDGVVNLPNGCACCTVGDDLQQALSLLVAGGEIDHVVVEASGVADPAATAAWSMIEPFEPGGVIVLAAVDAVRDLATDRYVGGEVVRQLVGADLILLTKLDRCDGATIDAAGTWLDRIAPTIARVPVVHGDVPASVLLGITPSGAPDGRGAKPDPTQHTERYETWAWSTERPVDRARLTTFLDGLPAGVLRLKGWVALIDGATLDVNVVGRTRDVRVGTPGSTAATATALVAIGVRGTPDPFAESPVPLA